VISEVLAPQRGSSPAALPLEARREAVLAASVPALSCVSLALAVSDGHNSPVGLPLVIAALWLVLAGVRGRLAPRDAAATASRWLGIAVALGFVVLLVRSPGVYLDPGAALWQFRLGVCVAAALAASYAWPGCPFARWRFAPLVATYLLLGAWVIVASPRPFIDVWFVQQRAADLLLHGQNPYAAAYDNIYGHTRFIGTKLLVDGRVQSFTYPPLSVLLAVPGWLLGDVRWTLLACVAGAAVFAVAAGRRLGLAAGHPAELAPVALLFHPRSFFLIEQAWTEPLIALAACALVWALAGREGFARSIALAGVLSAKQFGFLWFPALWAYRRVGWRAVLVAAALSLAVAAPFFLWDPSAFVRGNLLYQFGLPFRDDSLSIPAAIAATTGVQLPGVLGLVAAAAVAVLAARHATPEPWSAALGGAATFLAVFVFSDRAFFNYYWFASVLLVLAIVTAFASTGSRRTELG
jgi:hypothetical protein